MGYYLSIYNKQTREYEAHKDKKTTEYLPYKVPARYAVYVRGARVFFCQILGDCEF